MFGLGAPRRRWLVATLLAILLLPGFWGVLDGLRPVPRGVNDAGGEFAGPSREGGPIRFSTPATLDALAARGLRLVRLPFLWEQVQPALRGDLAPAAVESLHRYVREAHARGVQVILEPHNYARYTWLAPDGRPIVGQIGDASVPLEAFADFWGRMAREFAGQPGIYAYGLMNEPNHIGTKTWERASQVALDAIRATGDGTRILVPGNNYSSSYIWVLCHGRQAWIRDPLDNFAYEAHCYFDAKGGGHYALAYGEEAARDPDLEERTVRRLGIFVEWCESNGVEGFIGEFGAPRDPRWLAHLDRFLAVMDDARMGGTAWAAGDQWPADYLMLLQPTAAGDPPQLAVLRAHPGLWSAGRIPADFMRGYRVARRRLVQHARDAREAFHAWRAGLSGGGPRG